MLDRIAGKIPARLAARDALHGTFKTYTIGLALSLGLTILSFGAVMSGLVPHQGALATITLLAVAQLLVQLVFFLHLGAAPEQRNRTAIFVLTMLLIATVVSGSLWVMHNANANMMPTQMTPDRAMAKD
jgi:cytochrome o ubiquinol oxidase operon protein cyoD